MGYCSSIFKVLELSNVENIKKLTRVEHFFPTLFLTVLFYCLNSRNIQLDWSSLASLILTKYMNLNIQMKEFLELEAFKRLPYSSAKNQLNVNSHNPIKLFLDVLIVIVIVIVIPLGCDHS